MSLDLENPLELTVSQAVLALESNDSRFERFCCEVVSLMEGGALVLPTSTSWDLGRDGVGVGSARGTYVCVSLRDDVDAKALTDMERLSSTTKDVRHLYFCSSRKLSEHRITLLEEQLRDEADRAFDVTCLGSLQLTAAAAREPRLFEKHYGAEMRGALRAISADPSDEAEIAGLRLALMASVGENSVEIRTELYMAGLLDTLSDDRKRSEGGCAKDLSERLHLGRVISGAAVMPYLRSLEEAGFVTFDEGLYQISSEGLKKIELQRMGAAERFLHGRESVRQSIEVSIGEKISDADFSRIWEIMERRIASYFHSRGSSIVAEVSSLVEDAPSSESPQQRTPLSFLEDLATAVSQTSSHPQRRDEPPREYRRLFGVSQAAMA